MAALRIFTRSCFSAILQPYAIEHSAKCSMLPVTQIHKRWSTYKSSPIYKDPSYYTDYEISKDPVEWSYVERLMKYKTIPKPPLTNKSLPSGWRPATVNVKEYPYFVQRTKNHMQPVYLDRSFRGMRRITRIRKIQGDIWRLEEELKNHIEGQIGKRIGSRINELSGEIKFRGDYVSIVKRWLDSKGL